MLVGGQTLSRAKHLSSIGHRKYFHLKSVFIINLYKIFILKNLQFWNNNNYSGPALDAVIKKLSHILSPSSRIELRIREWHIRVQLNSHEAKPSKFTKKWITRVVWKLTASRKRHSLLLHWSTKLFHHIATSTKCYLDLTKTLDMLTVLGLFYMMISLY